MSIWAEINQLKGQTLSTLDQRKVFDVADVVEQAVIVRPHQSGIERKVPRDAIENAYQRLQVTGEITRTEIHSEFSLFNPAYVSVILAALPGVQYSIRPIRLWIVREG